MVSQSRALQSQVNISNHFGFQNQGRNHQKSKISVEMESSLQKLIFQKCNPIFCT